MGTQVYLQRLWSHDQNNRYAHIWHFFLGIFIFGTTSSMILNTFHGLSKLKVNKSALKDGPSLILTYLFYARFKWLDDTIHSGLMDHRQWRIDRLFLTEILENATNYSY